MRIFGSRIIDKLMIIFILSSSRCLQWSCIERNIPAKICALYSLYSGYCKISGNTGLHFSLQLYSGDLDKSLCVLVYSAGPGLSLAVNTGYLTVYMCLSFSPGLGNGR